MRGRGGAGAGDIMREYSFTGAHFIRVKALSGKQRLLRRSNASRRGDNKAQQRYKDIPLSFSFSALSSPCAGARACAPYECESTDRRDRAIYILIRQLAQLEARVEANADDFRLFPGLEPFHEWPGRRESRRQPIVPFAHVLSPPRTLRRTAPIFSYRTNWSRLLIAPNNRWLLLDSSVNFLIELFPEAKKS